MSKTVIDPDTEDVPTALQLMETSTVVSGLGRSTEPFVLDSLIHGAVEVMFHVNEPGPPRAMFRYRDGFGMYGSNVSIVGGGQLYC